MDNQYEPYIQIDTSSVDYDELIGLIDGCGIKPGEFVDLLDPDKPLVTDDNIAEIIGKLGNWKRKAGRPRKDPATPKAKDKEPDDEPEPEFESEDEEYVTDIEDGIYEVWIDAGKCAAVDDMVTGEKVECPITNYAFSALIYADGKGKAQRKKLTAQRQIQISTYICQECANTWEPLHPLRPGTLDKLAHLPEERKISQMVEDSYHCPKCKTAGKHNRGVPAKNPDGSRRYRNELPRFYMFGGEVRRLRKLLAIRNYSGEIRGTVTLNGEEIEIREGWKNEPKTWKWIDRDHRKHQIRVVDVIAMRGPLTPSELSSTSTESLAAAHGRMRKSDKLGLEMAEMLDKFDRIPTNDKKAHKKLREDLQRLRERQSALLEATAADKPFQVTA